MEENPQYIKEEEKGHAWWFLGVFIVLILVFSYFVYMMDSKPVNIGNDTSSLIDENGNAADNNTSIVIEQSQADKIVKDVTANSTVTINILPATV